MSLDFSFKKYRFAWGFALTLGLTGVPVAHGGDIATQTTQALNWGLLGKQLDEAITTAKKTTETVTNLKKQFEIMPGKDLALMLRGMDTDTQRISVLLNDLNQAKRAYEGVKSMLDDNVKVMMKMGMNPTEYIKLRIDLAEKKGKVYQDQLNADIQVINNGRNKGALLQQSMSNVGKITTHVQGFQALAAINAQVVGSLNDLTHTVASANLEVTRERQEKLDSIKKQNEMYKAANERDATITVPRPAVKSPLGYVGSVGTR